MAEESTRLPVKTAEKEAERAPVHRGWPPMESIRRDLNRLFEDFGDLWRSPLRQGLLGAEPLWSRELTWAAMPAVDVAEKDKAYEITAELPGNGRQEYRGQSCQRHADDPGREKGKRRKKRRRTIISPSAGTVLFERRFPVLEGVESDKIEASFEEGRAHCDPSENSRGAGSREENRIKAD
jgi:HSP20 family protein